MLSLTLRCSLTQKDSQVLFKKGKKKNQTNSKKAYEITNKLQKSAYETTWVEKNCCLYELT